MITNVFSHRYGGEPTEIVGRSAYHVDRDHIPHIFVCMDNFGLPRAQLEEQLQDKKVILLLRDPRDIAISHYFSFSKRATRVERIANNIPDSIEADGPYQFAINSLYGLPRIISFMNYWYAAVRRHPTALVIRYEDLKRNTTASFTPVMQMLLPEVTPEEIQSAVAASSFDRMKQMEAQGSFKLDILKPRVKSDSDSFKVRRGKIGGYADYLSASEKAVLDKMVTQTLMPEIGYG